jgi:hypothetical protein
VLYFACFCVLCMHVHVLCMPVHVLCMPVHVLHDYCARLCVYCASTVRPLHTYCTTTARLLHDYCATTAPGVMGALMDEDGRKRLAPAGVHAYSSLYCGSSPRASKAMSTSKRLRRHLLLRAARWRRSAP